MNEQAAHEFFARNGIDARRADPEVLNAAYRALAKKLHPDRGGSAEVMKDLNRAYDVLKAAINNGSYAGEQERERQERAERERQAHEQATKEQAGRWQAEKERQERAERERRGTEQQQQQQAAGEQPQSGWARKSGADASKLNKRKITFSLIVIVCLLWIAGQFPSEKNELSMADTFSISPEFRCPVLASASTGLTEKHRLAASIAHLRALNSNGIGIALGTLSHERGNSLTRNNVLFQDWARLNPYEFEVKYGSEVSGAMAIFSVGGQHVRRMADDYRSGGEVVTDAAVNFISDVIQGGGRLVTLGLSAFSQAAADKNAEIFNEMKEILNGMNSEGMKDLRFVASLRAELDRQDKELASGSCRGTFANPS